MQQYLEWYFFSRVKNSDQPFNLSFSPPLSYLFSPKWLSLSLSHHLTFTVALFFVYSLSNITWAREECNFSSFFSPLALSLSRESYTESPRAAVFAFVSQVCSVVWIVKKNFPLLCRNARISFWSLSSRSRLVSSLPEISSSPGESYLWPSTGDRITRDTDASAISRCRQKLRQVKVIRDKPSLLVFSIRRCSCVCHRWPSARSAHN